MGFCGRMASALSLAIGAACLGTCTHTFAPATTPRTSLRIAVALPTRTASFGLRQFIELLYSEPPIMLDWNGRPRGRIIESWKAIEAGVGLRLRIRSGVMFHDGKPLTAEVVRDVLRQELSGDANVTKIDADGNEIVIQLRQSDSGLLADLYAVSILAPWNRDVGTGPFKLVTHSQEPVLESFKQYYRGVPRVDRLEFQTYPSQRAAWAAMMRGQADLLPEVSRDTVEFIEQESAVKTYTSTWYFYIAFVFNLQRPELRNPAVRQAISEAVDRSALIKNAMRGRGVPADGPIWPYHWAYSTPARTLSYNPDAARLRLAAAGLSDLTRGSATAMPSRLRLRSIYLAEDARFDRIAMVVQKQLADVGIDVEMEPVKAEEFQARVASGKFDAFLSEMNSGRSFAWLRRFWHSPDRGEQPLFNSGYTAADGAIDRIRRAQTDDETRAAVAELQRVLYDDPPAVFLVWPQLTRAVDSHFRVPESDTGDILSSIWQWQRAPGLEARR
jgi:peptide/nickel transport system substrate-binding protein